MSIFIVNPKATDSDIDTAFSDRLTQARGICQYAINSSISGNGNFLPNTFWAIDELIGDAEQLYEELSDREAKRAIKKRQDAA